MRLWPWLSLLSVLIALGACATRVRPGSAASLEPSPDPPYRLPLIHAPAAWPLAPAQDSIAADEVSGPPLDAPPPIAERLDLCEQFSVELAQGEALAWISLAPALDFQDHVLWQGFRDRFQEAAEQLSTSSGTSSSAARKEPRCERALFLLRELSEGCERGPLSCPSTPHLILRDQVLLGYRSFSPTALAACGEADAALLRAHDAAAADTAMASRATLDPRLLDLAARVGALASLSKDAQAACRAVREIQDPALLARQADSIAQTVASILTQYGSALTVPPRVVWSAPRLLQAAERDQLSLLNRSPRAGVDARSADTTATADDELWSYWVLVPQPGRSGVAERMRQEAQLLRGR